MPDGRRPPLGRRNPAQVRDDRLAERLDRLRAAGVITSWQSFTGGGTRGRRWVIATVDPRPMTFTTREAEAFVIGASLARQRAATSPVQHPSAGR